VMHDPVVTGLLIDPEELPLVTDVIGKDQKATANPWSVRRCYARLCVTAACATDLPGIGGSPCRNQGSIGWFGARRTRSRITLSRAEILSYVGDDFAFVPVEYSQFDELVDDARVRDKTRRALSRLPEAYGYVLLWRYWERRSVREIVVET